MRPKRPCFQIRSDSDSQRLGHEHNLGPPFNPHSGGVAALAIVPQGTTPVVKAPSRLPAPVTPCRTHTGTCEAMVTGPQHHLPRSPEAVPFHTQCFHAASPGALSLPSGPSSHKPSLQTQGSCQPPRLTSHPSRLPPEGPGTQERGKGHTTGKPLSCTCSLYDVPVPRSPQTQRGRDRRQSAR